MKNDKTITIINFNPKIFSWTALGLSVSGLTAFKLWQNFYLLQSFVENYLILGVLVFIFLSFAIWISLNMDDWDSKKIRLFFFDFAILNGIILPLIFQFFTQNAIVSTFFILAGMFGIMSILGYFTKQDLTSWASLIIMAILGIVLNVLLNFVWRKDNFQLITSAIAIFVYVGIVAYDSKGMKEFNDDCESQKAVIMGAFALCLNLCYLFIALVMEANKGNRRGDV
jgi:uncharacterized protein